MFLICDGHGFSYEMTNLLMLFFPGEKIEAQPSLPAGGDGLFTSLSELPDGSYKLCTQLSYGGASSRAEGAALRGTAPAELELQLAVLAFDLLVNATGMRPPWGILTGVRPVKLMHAMHAEGLSEAEAVERLCERRLVSVEKAQLAALTARQERLVLAHSQPCDFSLYISIPFCPSRCSYCSFVSHSVERSFHLIAPYVERLCEELAATAEVAHGLGLRLRSIYIGGGTPTVLSAQQLAQITEAVARCFDHGALLEYTVEAGRPDTIDADKLAVLTAAGVGRISINPQTFEDEVLVANGRGHTAAQAEAAYALARQAGFSNINMDLIAGLPGDSPQGFERTVKKVLKLAPGSVTLHTLSIKRAAYMRTDGTGRLKADAEAAAQMVTHAHTQLGQAGYLPYYLYRQKNTLGNLENVGYSLPGLEGHYNVLMMDETHSILACGAGAVTKLREPGGDKIERIFNYKYPYEYLGRFEEMLRRKGGIADFYTEHPIGG